MTTIALTLLIAACSNSVGQDFSEAALENIHKGTTTRQQLVALFGSPDSETPYPDGQQILMWTHSEARALDTTAGKTLTVQLINNRVSRYTVSKS